MVIERSFLRPLETRHKVPPLEDSPASLSTGQTVTSIEAKQRRLPRYGWSRLSPADYTKYVQLYFGDYATNYSVNDHPKPLDHSLETYPSTRSLYLNYASHYTGRLTMAALVAEALHETHGITYEEPGVFKELYDTWQSDDIGANCGIDWTVARALDIPIIDQVAQRPPCIDAAARLEV
jgi:hypothetical protein